jgi:hypothetical protein
MFTKLKLKTLNITYSNIKFPIFNFIKKDFSIFQKIKKLVKSEDYKSTTESISASGIKNPDDIEIEYDKPDKEKLTKKEKESKKDKNKINSNKNTKGLTAEELIVLKNLPNETVSNKNKNINKNII